MTQRRIIHYSGRVQGVGFRFTAQMIAREHGVSGTVENLDDGRVKLVAEGEGSELDRFLEAINERMGGFIRKAVSEAGPATGEFSGFSVKH